MTHFNELDVIGAPATILTWLSMLELITMNPMADLFIKVLSLVWLSMQIYGWIEKRIKDKKNGSKQESGQTS